MPTANASNAKLIIAAANGFIGQELVTYFRDYEIVALVRNIKPHFDSHGKKIRYVQWDGKTLGTWAQEFEGAKAVINLAGRSVNCRYNEKNKAAIFASRLDSTKIIGEAINQCKNPPWVWINAGSATIYRHSTGKQMTEANGEFDNDFSVQVCKAWEKTFEETTIPRTRQVFLRISIVLGKSGGVFATLRKLTKLGLGGKHGTGEQFVSWIHIEDLCRSIEFLINRDDLYGVFNCAAPTPVRNVVFMQTLRKKLKIPFGLPQPRWILAIGTWIMRTEKELVLKSRNVIPERLTQSGFEFKFETIHEAMKELCS
ncbi:MAG TPA: TIGR01777 family oxidoreductase [Flavobacteriales bacterium]|nr:TIGR01777 family oxidoreductase [Flavobacteriales bacterium]